MDPQSSQNPAPNNLSLPPVDPQAGSVPPPAPAAPQPAVPSQPGTPQATASVQPGQAQATDASASPMIADDADLIEKAWVDKAKQLVDQTKNDPHKQSQEINKFKADYIKKRYNKDIQVNSG